MSLVVMIVVTHIFVKKTEGENFVELLKKTDEFYEKVFCMILRSQR
jgi:hypothetical protein